MAQKRDPLIDRKQYLLKLLSGFGHCPKPAARPPTGDAAKLTQEELECGRVTRRKIRRDITEDERTQKKLLFGMEFNLEEVNKIKKELADIESKQKMTPEERRVADKEQARQAVLPGGSLESKKEETANETQEVVCTELAEVKKQVSELTQKMNELKQWAIGTFKRPPEIKIELLHPKKKCINTPYTRSLIEKGVVLVDKWGEPCTYQVVPNSVTKELLDTERIYTPPSDLQSLIRKADVLIGGRWDESLVYRCADGLKVRMCRTRYTKHVNPFYSHKHVNPFCSRVAKSNCIHRFKMYNEPIWNNRWDWNVANEGEPLGAQQYTNKEIHSLWVEFHGHPPPNDIHVYANEVEEDYRHELKVGLRPWIREECDFVLKCTLTVYYKILSKGFENLRANAKGDEQSLIEEWLQFWEPEKWGENTTIKPLLTTFHAIERRKLIR